MSAPSSDGRHSVSSEPSAASSHTLNSRHSGAFVDNVQGSASQRPSPARSRHNSGAENGALNTGSSLSIEATEEQDFAHRRQRNRRSAGFLLDSSFAGGPRSRQPYNSPHTEDKKGKRSSFHSHGSVKNGREARLELGSGASTRSPLSREVRITDQDGADRNLRDDSANVQEDGSGGLRVAKARNNVHSTPSTAHDRGSEPDEGAPRPAFDPNQIVHMALNLSESRKRNLSAGQLLVPPPQVSSGAPQDGSFRSCGAGSSLRQYLNEQRRASRNISPVGGRSSPSGMRYMSSSVQRSGSLFIQGRPFDPSDATLARRDKARAFFELRMEYLRLLDFLPPLKPDSSAPGNFTVTANNMPGSPHAQLTRIPSYAGKQYELGRPYNPLQFLRNRRTRARERKTLDHPPEEFTDVNLVRDWVDRVERAATYPDYRQQDGVSLPELHGNHGTQSAPTKSSRPHMVWMFTAEELLADAHWLEIGDNKTVIEDRHGRKVFPPKEPQKQDFLQPRASKEYPEKRRKSWADGLPGVAADPATGDESDGASERGRKRRLLPTFRAESPRQKKHVRGSSSQQSRSYSNSSDSDSDAQQQRSRKPRRVIDVNNNTGPLELRMRELMEEEAKEAQTKSKSPAIFTPDTPDKWGRVQEGAPDNYAPRSSLEVPGSANGSTNANASFGLKLPPKNRTDPALSIDPSKEPRCSFDDLDSTAPSTPVHPRPFPHIGTDLSPPPSRDGSVTRKPRKGRLDIFRSDDSTKGAKHEHKADFDSTSSDKKLSSRQASEDTEEGNGFGSTIWAAPGAVKNLLGHRKNDSVSSLQSPEKEPKKEAKEPKEPPSAVTRFFKGVKSEGSKVGEFIFRRDRPPEDSETDTASDRNIAIASDSDSDGGFGVREGRHRPDLARSTTAQTAGSVTSKRNGHYHLELPSFRSSTLTQNPEDPAYATDSYVPDHPITRQARDRANSRSPRFDRLAPPRMDLHGISASSPSSPSRSQERISKILARPGGVGHGGLPHTALADAQASDTNRQRSSSRPTLEGKRHWSITDEDEKILHRKVTPTIIAQADVARVRALFLCSGIKAKEIARRAHAVRPRSQPAPFLVRAAKTANAELIPVSKKEEHVLAARILVRFLESSTQALQASAEEFRDSTVKELASMITTLKSRVESDLFPRVRNSADEAVKITSEVSSNAPLSVKQISDEVDRMLRMRRRRMRWVRRVGWMLVEWMLLGFMWFVWLIVVILGSVRRVFGFGFKVVRWLLWV